MAFSDNVWWTRKARIQLEKRLLSACFHSQLLLFWYSLVGVAASIFYVKFQPNSDVAGISWVVYSVMLLCVSIFIGSFSFKSRADKVKECYEALNTLLHRQADSTDEKTQLAQDYELILNSCENHKFVDHTNALIETYLTTADKTKVNPHPTNFHWFHFTKSKFYRFCILTLFYAAPIGLFMLLEKLA
jgi:hypothetical protein